MEISAVIEPNDGANHPKKPTARAMLSCMAGATGGLIFGYNLGVTGGVTLMAPFLEAYFPRAYRRQQAANTNLYCKFDSQLLTFFTSSLFLAALLSPPMVASVKKRCGLRISMMTSGLFFFAGAIIIAFAPNGEVPGLLALILGRVLIGFGVGFANQSVPLYISEMAPLSYRVAFNNLFLLSISVGIFIANLINCITSNIPGGWGWRLSLGLTTVPAVFIVAVSAFVLPDTPSSAVASEDAKAVASSWRILLQRKHRPYLMMAVFTPFFQHMSGMSFFLFYAPELFSTIGMGANASLISTLIIGGVNMLATFFAIFRVNKTWRRILFSRGGLLMVLFQMYVASTVGLKLRFTEEAVGTSIWFPVLTVIFICGHVVLFAWSWGLLGWLVPNEMMPLEIRSAVQSVVAATNMFMAFFLGQISLSLLCRMMIILFLMFAFFIYLMGFFIYNHLRKATGVPNVDTQSVWEEHWSSMEYAAVRGLEFDISEHGQRGAN